MPSWNELLNELQKRKDSSTQVEHWFKQNFHSSIEEISKLRRGKAVIVYASAFLQKRVHSQDISINDEDINGFMSIIKGLDCSKGLTLILHTPGGSPYAAEAIVNYLREKFKEIEVIVPTYAMSAGTMIALGADQIIMGKHSFLGPIDPQFIFKDRSISAHSIKSQFDRAKEDYGKDPQSVNIWIPILSSLGWGFLRKLEIFRLLKKHGSLKSSKIITRLS